MTSVVINSPLLYVESDKETREEINIFLPGIEGGPERERKAKVLIYFGKDGNLEPFCKMKKEFDAKCVAWGLTGNSNVTAQLKFQLFTLFLGGVALSEWQTICEAVPTRTLATFNAAVRTFIEKMSAGTNPRNTANSYLRSPEVRKRVAGTVTEHHRRLLLLFQYHDMLPGTSPNLCDGTDQALLARKEILFNTYPEVWRDEFRQQKGQIEDPFVTEDMILEFMMAAKTLKDKKYAAQTNRKSGRNTQGRSPRNGPRSQGSRYGGGRGNGGRFGGGFQNRMVPQFQPYPNYQGRSQGFQTRPPFQRNGNQGRAFGNRAPNGRFQGRGYRPPQGRGNYNGGQQHHHNETPTNYAESHYQEADSFVPDGTVPDGNQGGWPSADAGARYDQQQEQQFQQYYSNAYDQAQQEFEHDAGEHFYQDESPAYSGYDEPQFYQHYPADY